MEIKDKHVIVTGGANGLGRDFTAALAQRGARVAVLDRDTTAMEALGRELPDVICRKCDISDAGAVGDVITELDKALDGIDVLVNNAGIIHNGPVAWFGMQGIKSYDPAMWDAVIATNLSAVFYMSSAVLKTMIARRTKGLIVNISSICAAGNAGQSAYSAAKAGVNALTVTWAKEMGLYGIRVAGIAPGFTATATTVNSMKENVVQEWEAKTPLKRMAVPAEITDGLLFIIGNDFFNGRVLEVDGGLRL